jgi:hypothetical protein
MVETVTMVVGAFGVGFLLGYRKGVASGWREMHHVIDAVHTASTRLKDTIRG